MHQKINKLRLGKPLDNLVTMQVCKLLLYMDLRGFFEGKSKIFSFRSFMHTEYCTDLFFLITFCRPLKCSPLNLSKANTILIN